MEPFTIGLAVAALLGAKATEEFGTQAGSAAWQAVQRLGTLVRSRVSPQTARALDRIGDDRDAMDRVATEVASAAAADAEFRSAAQALLADVELDQRLAGVIAVARDNAKQVNIAGGSIGSITL
ncbi:hypothetical protein GCE86_07160 [Micromonospora terminaliae]|uniref:Uncharacterized protein n=1 Tax=Micromonospora terminaliae TaxID=1914461 RepID=A0AAJ3DKL0_9ACTN|nr:hypothetical protein [Micromonospora terminaliae]NES29972.1 hypothetical protein [Micromonospora terminaliae]QGL46852.1 hypothetical protein GCE86_07160 [Micromonospora terminaliae]